MRPRPEPAICTCTRVSRWSESRLLELEQAGRPGLARRRRVRGSGASAAAWSFLTASSVARTDRPVGDDPLRPGPRWPSASSRPSSVRAWPALRARSLTSRATDGRQLQQPQGVGHRGPALAHPAGDVVLAEGELLGQLRVGRGLLQRGEVLALEVLDQGLLERGGVGDLADQRRDRGEAGLLGGPPAALAGDQLEVVADRAHQDRLEDAELADRRRQRRQGLVLELGAGLVGVGPDRGRSAAPAAPSLGRRRGPRRVRDEGAEALTQPAAASHR